MILWKKKKQIYQSPLVYSPEQGQTTYWGQNFEYNRKAFSLCPYVASFKMISSKSDFIHIFNEFIHVYSPGPRAYNPLGTNFWCQQKALITLPICCKFKKSNLILYTFLMNLYMYIALGQGQRTPWEQTFDLNRKALSFWPFVASFKKITLESDFIHIFKVFMHVYSPRPGADNPLVTKFWRQQKAQITLTICCKFQNDLLILILYTFFNYFIRVYSPRARADKPLGSKFWCHQKALTTSTICCKFKKNLFEFWFYTHFLMFFHYVYSPGAGADNPLWTKFWCQQKGIVTLPICCKFQKNIFEVWLYTYLCLFFYIYIAPGQRQTTPLGSEFLF